MTWLNPTLWLGLLLAGLPILIHLLGRRRMRRQPFPSLELLRKLATRRAKRLRVRRWLLLALRTLGVLLLALAFLRPALRQAAGAGGASSATVVLLDLSASMAARGGEGRDEDPLHRARRAVREVWEAGGRVGLVVAQEGEREDVPLQEAAGEAPDWVEELAADGRAQVLAPAFRRAARMLASSPAAVRELVWLSDFRFASPDTLPALPEGARLYRVPLAAEEAPFNGSVQGVRREDPLARAGGATELELELASWSGSEEVEAVATVSLEGRRAAEGSVRLQRGRTTRPHLPVRLPQPGRVPGEVELELDDALPLDNRLAFVMEVPRPVRVLITGEDLTAMRNLELALTAGREESGGQVRVRPGGLGEAELGGYDVVVLAGTAGLPPVRARRLAQFVRSGGGLWLFLSEGTDPAALSRGLLEELDLGPVVGGGERRARSRWEDLDRTHPALERLLTGEGDYDAPLVRRAFATAPAEGVRTLVRLGDGRPFLLERTLGKGRIWWTPAAARDEWTDWPTSGIFAPLVRQGAHYLASGRGGGVQVTDCGQPLAWPLPEGGSDGLAIRDPLGNELPATPGAGGPGTVGTEHTNWPGHYTLLRGGEVLGMAAAQVPAEESNLAARPGALPGEELAAADGGLGEELVRRRFGRELASLLLLAALACFVGESVLAREGDQGAEGVHVEERRA